MDHTWKNGSHLEKCVTCGKIFTLRKFVTLGKMSHIWKNGSLLETWITLGNMCHTWTNWSQLANVSHLEKWVTIRKMGYI